MSVTDELNQWVAEHGSERDALNVALAKLHLAEAEADRLTVTLAEAQDTIDTLRRGYSKIAHEGIHTVLSTRPLCPTCGTPLSDAVVRRRTECPSCSRIWTLSDGFDAVIGGANVGEFSEAS